MDDSNKNVEDAQRPYSPGPRQARAERPTTGISPMRTRKTESGVTLAAEPEFKSIRDTTEDQLRQHMFGDDLPHDTQSGEATYDPADAIGAPTMPNLTRIGELAKELEEREKAVVGREDALIDYEQNLNAREATIKRAETLVQEQHNELRKYRDQLLAREKKLHAHQRHIEQHYGAMQRQAAEKNEIWEQEASTAALSFGPEDVDTQSGQRDRTEREVILERARELTTGDRNRVYGDPVYNHENIAGLWNAYITTRSRSEDWDGDIDAEDVAMMQVLLKVTRIAQRRGHEDDARDSFVDLCGYAAIAGECRERRW